MGYRLCDDCLRKICCAHPFMASLYYCFFSRQFRREQYAVLCGATAYGRYDYEAYLLRRNTHRIEKALIIASPKPNYAIGFITETVDAYALHMQHQQDVDQSTLQWATDVLAAYFGLDFDHPVFIRERTRYQQLRQEYPLPFTDNGHIPLHRTTLAKPDISYDAFLALASYRKSVRGFLPQAVDHALVDKAVKAAMLSPTACNRIPYRFLVIDQPAMLKQVVKLPGGVDSYADNIPMMVAVIGNLSAYCYEHDRHLIYIDASLASMTFCYAAETLGLATCCINWPDIECREQKAAQLLALKPYERIVMFLAVGYEDPSRKVPFSAKKELRHVVEYDDA
jgi:nitroreductase